MEKIKEISPELVQFFLDCFSCENVSIILDSLSNFIEILPIFANKSLIENGQQIVTILLENVKKSIEQAPFTMNLNSNSGDSNGGQILETDEEQFNRVMICNNACWLMGELAMRIPQQITPSLNLIIDILADILNMYILESIENGTSIDKKDNLEKRQNENLGGGDDLSSLQYSKVVSSILEESNANNSNDGY